MALLIKKLTAKKGSSSVSMRLLWNLFYYPVDDKAKVKVTKKLIVNSQASIRAIIQRKVYFEKYVKCFASRSEISLQLMTNGVCYISLYLLYVY